MSPWALRQLDTIETPSLVVDQNRLDRNIERMESRAKDLGVALRPHLKTGKSIELAERIPSFHTTGGTVSTMQEATAFGDQTEKTLLYARTPTASALSAIGMSQQTDFRLNRVLVAVDSIEHFEGVPPLAPGYQGRFRVLIEIDSGEHRSGLQPDDPDLPRLVRELTDKPDIRLEGVFTHGGHSYEAKSIDTVRAIAEQERQAIVAAAEIFAEAGVDCPIRSVGSTPTVTHATHYDGCTEVRAGVFVFQDLFQVGMGNCDRDDLALSVATRVIGRRARDHRLLIDAGGIALSKDRSTRAFANPDHQAAGDVGDCGYGLVCNAEGELLEGLQVVEAWQEHGVVEARPGFELDIEDFPIGTMLRILPNHACMTAAAHEAYNVLMPNGQIRARWKRENGW
ncbi:MAG: alanine racemase [Planctomycetota bacterium]